MRWVFDLDGTICDTKYKRNNGRWEYNGSTPRKAVIEKINTIHDEGEYIIIFTARGSIHIKDWRPETEAQLKEWGVKYDELRFGKPGGEIYVDDRTITPDDFVDRFAFYQGLSKKWEYNKE